MKNIVGGGKKNFFIVLSAILLGSAFTYSRVFSYDSNIAHPNITDFAVQTYNATVENRLSDKEIYWLKKGSIEEDMPPRWMNHFYDPVYKKGLTYKGLTYTDAKNWSQSSGKQRLFSLGDYTWQRAIYDYQKGYKEQAFIGLGHIIHLISDMGVPAHTRDDDHPEGDSYEQFVKYNYPVLAEGLKNVDMNMVYLDDINKYFEELALYSNNNFYSDDTIESEKYKKLKVDVEYIKNDEYGFNKLFYTKNERGDKYYLYLDANVFTWLDIIRNNHVISQKILKNKFVLTSYTKQLFPKAVGYSAGVIKLFFEEVEKEHDFKPPTRMTLLGAAMYLAGDMFDSAVYLYDLAKKDEGVVKADENTVLDIMTKDTVEEAESVNTDLELATALPLVTQNTPVLVQPENETPEPVIISPPVINKPEPVVTDLSKPILPSQTNDSSFHFVFGSGGERVISPTVNTEAEPAAEEQTQTTSTEEIIETPTTTPEIIEETVTSTEPIVEESPSSTEEIIITSTTTPEIIEAPISTEPIVEETTTSTEPIAEDPPAPVIPVVINEIAWMGTASNKSSDEWLELYNNTDTDIDLSGWKIKVSDKYLTWNNTSSTIKAKGYYLLERTSDSTVSDITADGIFTLSGGLKNTGENLILLNNNGEVIDQVDNSNGWFAGETGVKYKTMERVNSFDPGNEASNWQTSDYFSVKGKGQGGVQIYGTPRQPNKGHWYLQNLTINYTFDENKTLTLTEENNPYFFGGDTEIPAGYILKLEEGVVLSGVSKTSYLKVKGKLLIEGTAEKPVMFTSARDKNYVDFNFTNLTGENPEPGDWGRIEITDGGKMEAVNVKFLYGGQEYFAAGGFVFGGKWPSRIINNLGGELHLDHAEFKNNFTHQEDANNDYDALIWIEPANKFSATTTIDNSIFDGGYLAIKNQKQYNYLSINNSTFTNFNNIYGPIASRYDLPVLENNILQNNTRNTVLLDSLVVDKNTTLTAASEYLASTITVNTGATLQISPGTILNLLPKSNIKANGNLVMVGEEGNRIIIRSANVEEYWGNIIFTDSISNLEYADISGGNGKSLHTTKGDGMLWMQDSDVKMNNVLLADASRPYAMIYADNSSLVLTDGMLSWSSSKTTDLDVNGIRIKDGSLYLNNTRFNEMDRGIEFYGVTAVEMENMTLNHFTNIADLNWWPVSAFTL